MKRLLCQCAVGLCMGLVAVGAFAGPANTADSQVDDLASAERAFAAQAQTLGVREAFLRHLAEDAWLMRPQPVRAKAWFDAHPSRAGSLEWGPEYAEIAASGNFGYTYGPWNSKAPNGEQGAGHFFSVWKRDPDGAWKNVLDHGIGHGPVPLDVSLTLHAPGSALAAKLPPADFDARRADLLAIDDALNGANAQVALAKSSSAELRLFENGKLPQIVATPAASALAPAGLRREGSDVAESGDLAYTIGGRVDAKADAPGGYVRMWRRDVQRGWLLVVAFADAPAEPSAR